MVTGFAKSLFKETHKATPWRINRGSNPSTCLMLDLLFQRKQCTYLDYVLTLRLLRPYGTVSPDVAIFICHLIMAAREGHLCVRVEPSGSIPGVPQIWGRDGKLALSFEETQGLSDAIIQGARNVPAGLMTELGVDSLDVRFHTPLCQMQNTFYLQRHWMHETIFLRNFIQHLKTSPVIAFDEKCILESIERLHRQGLILPEQGQAIEKACLNPLSIVTGGPGTGKTYTAAQVIRIFWENLSVDAREDFEIAIAAPTGKAVANLQKNLGQIIRELPGNPKLTARTLHALLGIKGNRSGSIEDYVRLTADLIIVDESSMIDIHLMSRLFEALKAGSRIILLGDRHQLPSVEAGSVFADLIHLSLDGLGSGIPFTELKVCLRAELKSIVEFAALVNEGRAERALEVLRDESCRGINHIPLNLDKKNALDEFIKEVSKDFVSWVKDGEDSKDIINLFQSVRILSPMRKGIFGVDELNKSIRNHFASMNGREGWLPVPIMIVTNDYRKDLFNGETGVLMRRLPLNNLHPEDYALFASRDGDLEPRRISAILLPKYEYAYCLSVHKSQGSEFDRIILTMPDGSEIFGREVFYTAITRARRQIDIYGSLDVIYRTLSQKGGRLSGIVERARKSLEA
jgi:exodeoxyribonuclease V alpha subunit